MLKFLFTSKLPLRLFQKNIAYFTQQQTLREYDYLSDGDTEQESKELLSKFAVYQHFVNAQTTEEVIRAFNQNNLSYEQIHFAAFQLMNIINHKQIQQDTLLDEFVQEKIIPYFDRLSSEQCVTIIQLFLKLQNRSYSMQIKKNIDLNLKNYTYLQLPYIFSFYSKQGWKTLHICKLLRQHLSTQTFTAHSLCQIIRGAYIEYSTLKLTYNSDLAYLASQQLINLIDNINFHGLVAVFNQLARMHLDKNTTYKQLPQIIYQLSDRFILNFDKISQYSKLKLLEAYSELPESFPNTLFKNLYQSFESEYLTSSNQLKLYIFLKIQKQKNQPSTKILQRLLNKIRFDSNIEMGLLIRFLEIEYAEQNQKVVNICIKHLKRNYNHLSIKQKTDFIKVVIKQNKLDEIYDLNQINDYQLLKITEQLYYCHKQLNRYKQDQQDENIRKCVQQFFEQLEKSDYEQKLRISSFIITLDPYQDDPFYDFIDRHIQLESLPEHYFQNFILRLNSKSHYNQVLRKKSEQLTPSFDQLQWIITNLNNIDFLNDKLVNKISKWFLILIDKSINDQSFNLNSLNLLIKFTLTCPIHSIRNMRGTILQPIRELIEIFTNKLNQSQQSLQIQIEPLFKFNELINQLDFRSNIVIYICQKLCNQASSLNDLEKLQIAALITEFNVHQISNIQVISDFLNFAVQVELDTYEALVIKTKIYLYQLKNQVKFRDNPDVSQINLVIDQLKQEIVRFNLEKTNQHYLDGLMVLLEYEGWRQSNLKYEDDGLKDFIELNYDNINHLITINDIRPGLKEILKTIGKYDSKYQFIRNYDKIFKNMLLKCHNLGIYEIPQVSVCLDFIEFAKKVKLNNDDTIYILVNYIIKQVDDLKQIQIVEVIINLSEQKVYSKQLFDILSKQISKKFQFYSNFELIDILNSYAKVGYFNESLILNILDNLQSEQKIQLNAISNVQTLWSTLISLQYLKIQNKNYYQKYEKLVTNLMKDVHKFPKSSLSSKMPVVFRQFMDIFNLLEFSLHLDLQLNQKQQQIGKLIIENSKNLVHTKFIPNQKVSPQFKSLMQYLDKSQIEYKVNYFLDNQYVDFYIQMRNQIISVDNSLYLTYDMKHYTGFYYFNKWILEGAAKKYELKEIRVNANQWSQMDDDQKRKVLLM